VLIIGAALVAIGLGATWLILNNVGLADLNNWMLLPALFVAGAGNGCFLAPNVQFIVATVENSEAGAASGVVQTMQRLGTAIGVAVIASVLFDAVKIGPTSTPAIISAEFKTGATNAMLWSTILAVVAFVLVFSLPRRIQLNGAPPVAAAE
jgi:fucose permease